jgi:glycosyltransferase involved in cell wall biosynthesis
LRLSKGYPVEYIVVDDGSDDATPEILKNYNDLISILRRETSGDSAAVNLGLKHARGEFILVVSADDPLFTSSIFEGVEDFFNTNESVVAWYPDWNLIDYEGRTLEVRKVPEYQDQLLIGEFFCLPGPGTMIRKSAAVRISGRDSRYKFTGDYDFWLRLSRIGELRHRREVLGQWRMHEDSTSISRRGREMALERIHVVENFVNNNSIDSELKRSALVHAYYFASRLVSFDRKVPGRRYLLKAFKIQQGWIPGVSVLVVLFIAVAPLSTIGMICFRKSLDLRFPGNGPLKFLVRKLINSSR